MKLSVQNRDQMYSVGAWLADEFDQSNVKVNNAWLQEHTQDDAHGDVTAWSLTTLKGVKKDDSSTLSTGNVTVGGNLILSSGGVVKGDLLPSINNFYNLGNSLLAWKQVIVGAVGLIQVTADPGLSISNGANEFFLSSQVPNGAGGFATELRTVWDRQSMPPNIFPPVPTRTYFDWRVNGLSVVSIDETGTLIAGVFSGALHGSVTGGFGSFTTVDASDTVTITTNNKFLKGKTSAAATKALIGVGSTDKVSIDSDGLGAVFGSAITERARTTPMGEWIDVAFAAGNFTASAGNWTLTSGDQIQFRYMLIGKTMFVSYVFDTTSVSATPSQLRFTIPGGFTAAKDSYMPLLYKDNGGAYVDGGTVFTQAGLTFVALQLGTFGISTWATSVDLTYVRGVFILEIQ